jgi:activator of HSP90 ATPase
MPYSFELHCVLPAAPREVYDAWLSSQAHSAMTGGEAHMSGKVGGRVSAWDGYITGENLELEPGRKIVQSWRTTQFGERDPDSKIEVTLAPDAEGCKLTLRHSDVPDGQTSYERGGWRNHYFEPMRAFFAAKRGEASVA